MQKISQRSRVAALKTELEDIRCDMSFYRMLAAFVANVNPRSFDGVNVKTTSNLTDRQGYELGYLVDNFPGFSVCH